MASNFSPELSYSEDKSSNPYIMENSNALENNKNIILRRTLVLLKISTL